MCAGVCVVVLARVLVEKMPIGSCDTSHARVCRSDTNTRMVAVPVYAEQPRSVEATILDKAHSRIWQHNGQFMVDTPAEKWGHSFLALRMTLPALLRSDVRR
jgi:hypothetical protein